MTSLPASDPGSAAVWGSKRINPRPQSCLCLTWSGPSPLQTTTTIGRRGSPRDVYSDNGSNFVGEARELKKAISKWNQSLIDKTLCQKGILWHFNPPAASHQGGVWERVIRSVRRILTALAGERVLTDECLSTFVTEVERILK